MPTTPSPATIKRLFALSSNRCAFPNCQTHIVDPRTSTVLGEVCHIRSHRSGGPRFDVNQTPDERQGLENLILLCSVHHKLVDSSENLDEYTPAKLLEMKRAHESLAQSSSFPGPTLTDDLVAKLQVLSSVYESGAVHMDFREAIFRAGGEGGHPGGGGGGGGVITIVGADVPPLGAVLDLNGGNGRNALIPGAGGGGGGGGGTIEYVGRSATAADVALGLRASSFFAANAVSISGLFNVLGGGWEYCTIPSLPSKMQCHLVSVLELSGLRPHTLYRLTLEVLNPDGQTVLTNLFDIAVPESRESAPRRTTLQSVAFEVGSAGVWCFRLSSGEIELSRLPLEIRVAS